MNPIREIHEINLKHGYQAKPAENIKIESFKVSLTTRILEEDIDDDGNVDIRMTLTTPACPVAGSMPGQVECAVRAVPGVRAVKVELVWDPPWTRDRLDMFTRLELGLL